MIEIAIPGRDKYIIRNLILDLNGTIAVDGNIIGGVKEKLAMLSQKLDIFLVTADMNKNAERLVKDLPVKLYKIKETEENNQKLRVVLKKGKNNTVSIGNGCNDVSMLKESAIGICMVGGEGASAEAMMASDLVVVTINDALDLLLKPHRLGATLRR
ncbi:MAG: HAD hydrolase family protein [Deltaproteobacteria bacterium]|nr:HAD hydrolase family protein [Deltaproteobacteria bacterium]